jgi:putative SOS response-associated peptidase YedK
MPVIVLSEDQDRWLSGENVTDLPKPLPAGHLEIWPSIQW